MKKKLFGFTIMVKRSNDENALKGWLYYVKFPDKEIKRVDGRFCLAAMRLQMKSIFTLTGTREAYSEIIFLSPWRNEDYYTFPLFPKRLW
jgi:hypothetical protein